MYKKYLMGEPVMIARPFGKPFLRGLIGTIVSRPRPCVHSSNVLFEEYAVEVGLKAYWIPEKALDKMEVVRCE